MNARQTFLLDNLKWFKNVFSASHYLLVEAWNIKAISWIPMMAYKTTNQIITKHENKNFETPQYKNGMGNVCPVGQI